MPGFKKLRKNAARAEKLRQRKEHQRSGGSGDPLKFSLWVKRIQDAKSAKNMKFSKLIERSMEAEIGSHNNVMCAAAQGHSMCMSGTTVMLL